MCAHLSNQQIAFFISDVSTVIVTIPKFLGCYRYDRNTSYEVTVKEAMVCSSNLTKCVTSQLNAICCYTVHRDKISALSGKVKTSCSVTFF